MIATKLDTWLSSILSRPAYRVDVTNEPLQLHDFAWFQSEVGPSFCFSKFAARRIDLLRAFEEAGFKLAEVALTLEMSVQELNYKKGIVSPRFAVSSDELLVRKVAGSSFELSRFHTDPTTRPFAHRIKEEWAGNYFHGKRGDSMVVAEVDGALAGFLQLLNDKKGCLVIDLIAVSNDFRSRGVGGAMIAFAIQNLTEFTTVRVGTQAHNLASIRLYEKLGFRAVGAEYVVHRHALV